MEVVLESVADQFVDNMNVEVVMDREVSDVVKSFEMDCGLSIGRMRWLLDGLAEQFDSVCPTGRVKVLYKVSFVFTLKPDFCPRSLRNTPCLS